MIVMPANSTGWYWHSLALLTGRIGHLFSPGAQRGPWPWFPYALDNGAFSCWNMTDNTFDEQKWKSIEAEWRRMLFWATSTEQRPMWAIVPDRPGNAEQTFQKWSEYVGCVVASGISAAIAVQDGMTVESVKSLSIQPDVICVGGTTEWKWETVESWANSFKRVHLLRCNMPDKLDYLQSLGVESCDGTGWNRGDRRQTEGLERWAKRNANPVDHDIFPFVSRATCKHQITFA